MRTDFTDDVNGVVIGPVLTRYEFWIKETREEYQTKRGIPERLLAKAHFENDEEAVAWLKSSFPAEFKQGVEMRVFDQD